MSQIEPQRVRFVSSESVMSQIEPQRVRFVSSESVVFPASNLLNFSLKSPWKCESSADTEASVEFEFDGFVTLDRVEMGNSDSGFVEIFVFDEKEQKYCSLLISTPLMTIREAMNGEKGNKIRNFNSNHFIEQSCCRKWKRLKIVCTQPFNKLVHFGLSLVKFFGLLSNDNAIDESPHRLNHIDISKLRKLNPDGDCSRGALFRTREIIPSDMDLYSSKMFDNSLKVNNVSDHLPLNKDDNLNLAKDDIINFKSINQSKSCSNQSDDEINCAKSNECLKTPQEDIENVYIQEKVMGNEGKQYQTLQEDSTSQMNVHSAFVGVDIPTGVGDILGGVTFVMSGYQNPLRNVLRDKGIMLGAKYRPTWTDSCTHLICAFPNTPKFREVCGRAIVVNDKWITDCYSQKQHLPWRQYCVRYAASPKFVRRLEDTDNKREYNEEFWWPSFTKRRRETFNVENDRVDDFAKMDIDTERNAPGVIQSRSVTLPELPSIFSDINFFFYKMIEYDEKRKLTRLIRAFGGVISEYMNSDVRLVITDASWEETFNEAILDNAELRFVNPSWIYECDKSRCLHPIKNYQITKE